SSFAAAPRGTAKTTATRRRSSSSPTARSSASVRTSKASSARRSGSRDSHESARWSDADRGLPAFSAGGRATEQALCGGEGERQDDPAASRWSYAADVGRETGSLGRLVPGPDGESERLEHGTRGAATRRLSRR